LLQIEYVPGGGFPAEGRKFGKLTASSNMIEPTPVLFHFRASAKITEIAKSVRNWKIMVKLVQILTRRFHWRGGSGIENIGFRDQSNELPS
jgi:hypothetical protein